MQSTAEMGIMRMSSMTPTLPLLHSPPLRAPGLLLSSISLFSRSPYTLAPQTCSPRYHRHLLRLSVSDAGIPEEESLDTLVQVLRIPQAWLVPSIAREESEWLRIALHNWLDNEYCPEPSNFEISKVAAESYHESLMSKQTDVGEILLKMVTELETLSFQQSFHGPFSSANAAVHLITKRIDSRREQ